MRKHQRRLLPIFLAQCDAGIEEMESAWKALSRGSTGVEQLIKLGRGAAAVARNGERAGFTGLAAMASELGELVERLRGGDGTVDAARIAVIRALLDDLRHLARRLAVGIGTPIYSIHSIVARLRADGP